MWRWLILIREKRLWADQLATSCVKQVMNMIVSKLSEFWHQSFILGTEILPQSIETPYQFSNTYHTRVQIVFTMTSRNTPVQTQQHYPCPKLTYKYYSTSRGGTPEQIKATFFSRRVVASLNAYLRCSAGNSLSYAPELFIPELHHMECDGHRHGSTWYGKPSLAMSYLSPREAVGYKPHCCACKVLGRHMSRWREVKNAPSWAEEIV